MSERAEALSRIEISQLQASLWETERLRKLEIQRRDQIAALLQRALETAESGLNPDNHDLIKAAHQLAADDFAILCECESCSLPVLDDTKTRTQGVCPWCSAKLPLTEKAQYERDNGKQEPLGKQP